MPTTKVYLERRAAGLCGNCGAADPGGALCDTCAAHKNAARRARYAKDPQRHADRKKRQNRAIAKEVFEHYGKTCVCCGESEFLFLTIDHVNGGGTKHRKEVGQGTKFYRWLRREGYPDGYQVLCMNCNLGRHRNGGVCPHG